MELLLSNIAIISTFVVNIVAVVSAYWKSKMEIKVLQEKIETMETKHEDFKEISKQIARIETKLEFIIPQLQK
jgi:hypothetical protein